MSIRSLLARIIVPRKYSFIFKGRTVPDDIVRYDDISYGKYGKSNRLDVYHKKGVSGKQPVILSVHGGGFVCGSKAQYQFYCMNLAQRGFTVVNIDYRLAPKYKFPTPIYDVNAVLEWININAEQFNMDRNNVFIVGDSAGAQIVSQYAIVYSNPEYAKLFNLTVSNVKLRAVGLNCGAYSIDDDSQVKGTLLDYFGKHPIEKYKEQIKMLDYVNENFPPAYIVSAVKDYLKPKAEPMAELLRSHGVDAVCKIYRDEQESIAHVFHLNIDLDVAIQCNDDETNFFKEKIESN